MRPRGAFPSPRSRAYAVAPVHPLASLPPFFGIVPSQLSYWGNNRYGDCVSAEEAFAKSCYSLMCGLPQTFVTEANLILWARAHGYLNGANLTDVLDTMAQTGLPSGSAVYTDGAYKSVDWTSDAILSSALVQGPVKIGVAASQLENAVGNVNGWWGTGFRTDNNQDHCVSLCGYGPASDLATMLKVAVPSSVKPTATCYLLFTWSTIGIIDQPSLIAITGEAWLRNPTTEGQVIIPPLPPTPLPIPPAPAPLGYPMAGTYQCGVYSINWTAVLNDPLPLPPS